MNSSPLFPSKFIFDLGEVSRDIKIMELQNINEVLKNETHFKTLSEGLRQEKEGCSSCSKIYSEKPFKPDVDFSGL